MPISGQIHLQDKKEIITLVIVLLFPVYTTPCTKLHSMRCLATLVAWQQMQHGECCTYSTMMRPQNYTCELTHMCKLLHTRNSISNVAPLINYGDVTLFTESHSHNHTLIVKTYGRIFTTKQPMVAVVPTLSPLHGTACGDVLTCDMPRIWKSSDTYMYMNIKQTTIAE